MNYCVPEKCGVSTELIYKYINHLNDAGLSTHSVIIARGNNVIFEKYWEPFERDFLHRLYSVTKSFVAIAIGFLWQDGKINLDDPISVYFPEETAKNPDENIRKQTIRHMMGMRSAFPKAYPNWFKTSPEDRVLDYFTNNSGALYPSGTLFRYDSTGSFVLGALVERVTGMKIVDYLYEKFLAKLGVEGAYALECPGGHSWMDSALLMRPIDLMKVSMFLLNGGEWNGEQLLDREFINEAVSKLVSTDAYGASNISEYGYGYLIWRMRENSFFLNGMGCQLAVIAPEKDMILVYNGDNQGNDLAKSKIIDGFFDIVYSEVKDEELPHYKGESVPNQKLFYLKGNYTSSLVEKIKNKTYVLDKNPMGISEFTIGFENGEGSFRYVNATGEKTIHFGLGKNVFEKFPEEGYSDKVGSKRAPGNKYDSAVSASFPAEDQLLIRVQIIDKYFGNLAMLFAFKDDIVVLEMKKCAEDFLEEYKGIAVGKIKAL